MAESHTNPSYVYIVSRGRSGSTLLERLLSNHPQFTALGEIEKLSLQYVRQEQGKYAGQCSCGLAPLNCPVWSEVARAISTQHGVEMATDAFSFRVSDIGLEEDWGSRVPRHWIYNRFHRISRSLGYSTSAAAKPVKRLLTQSGEGWAKNRLFVASVLSKLTSSSAVVDSSKDHLGMRDMYDYGNGRTKIIFLTRDVRGNVWSSLKGEEKREATEVAQGWVRDNKRILTMLKGVEPNDWLHVKYEELCADPRSVCETLCKFLGYEFDSAMLEDGLKQHHTIGGNRIRYGRIKSIKQDIGWKDGLTSEQIGQIELVAGPFASSIGYSF